MMRGEVLRRRILERAPYDEVENVRIYEKFFRRVPLTFRVPLTRYRLHERKVLDVGSSYGQYLVYFGPGSLGLDVNEKMIAFSRAIGLSVVHANVGESLPIALSSFDVVWCSNFLEHVISPHTLLRSMHAALRPDGIVIIKVPLAPHPFVGFLMRVFLGMQPGYLAREHIYAYTTPTIRFLIERAGFKIIESSLFWPSSSFLRLITDFFALHFGVTGTFVARRI